MLTVFGLGMLCGAVVILWLERKVLSWLRHLL